MGASCLKNNDGKIVVEENKLMDVWKVHYDKTLNEEFTSDK